MCTKEDLQVEILSWQLAMWEGSPGERSKPEKWIRQIWIVVEAIGEGKIAVSL